MSLSDPLILLAILVLSLLILVGLLPFGLRWLAQRNRETRRRLAGETAALDRHLLNSAERLRPFGRMKAVHFQEQREAVRQHLLKAREERREIDGRLSRLRLVEFPATGWPGEFFLRQPAYYVLIPFEAWHLRQAGRLAARIRGSLEAAGTEQENLHQLPQALRQAAMDLQSQSLPKVAQALEVEKTAGLGRLDALYGRLQNLQQRTADLVGSLRTIPAAQDDQTDELALELESITNTTAQLEEEIAAVHNRRSSLDGQREQLRASYDSLLQSLPTDRPTVNLAPILEHIDVLFEEADEQRGRLAFDSYGAMLKLTGQFTDLGRRLFETGLDLEQLVKIRQVPQFSELVKPVLNQWPPLIQQAHQLLEPDNDNIDAGIHALSEMTGRIQVQAQKILTDYEKTINQIEAHADKAMDDLATSWDKLQTILPLTVPDPLAASYHALWPKREAARGVPALLETFVREAGHLSQEINATCANLLDHQRHMQETIGRLPAILAEAQELSQDWQCLQRLAEQLAALRASLENLAQTAFTTNTREAVNQRLTEFQEQADQLSRIQEELRFEAHEIERLDNMIRDHWQALQDNPADVSEAKYNRAVKMTDTQYDRALSAEQCKTARAALEKCLSYVEKLALN
ncbi:MAG: hypothetical protein WAM60_15840 [Candidatus Promineifilaceae bacterium]